LHRRSSLGLRKRRYVDLVPDPRDGRAKLVRLTQRGWKVHAMLVSISREFETECARGLGKEKWGQLHALREEFAAWARRYSKDRNRP
jgi:DNA-binding MarR family transcriptional regulator